jgi:hypothetical protein
MAFEQAQIPLQKVEEFEKLRTAIERAFAGAMIGKLLGRVQRSGARIREFEKVLEKGIFEAVDQELSKSELSARQLYAALSLSDQALMREFYLERIEQVDPKVRQRYQKIYQYY